MKAIKRPNLMFTKQTINISHSCFEINLVSSALNLKFLLYNYYFFCFYKNHINIKALINWNNKINTIYLAYFKKISLSLKKTDINVLNIDESDMVIFGMIIIAFLVNDKERKIKFLEKLFIWLTLA